MRPKAQKEAFTELCLVADYYGALQERYKRDLLVHGKITDESKALLRQVDRRAERIYK
jgi:hypothetical protein